MRGTTQIEPTYDLVKVVYANSSEESLKVKETKIGLGRLCEAFKYIKEHNTNWREDNDNKTKIEPI